MEVVGYAQQQKGVNRKHKAITSQILKQPDSVLICSLHETLRHVFNMENSRITIPT